MRSSDIPGAASAPPDTSPVDTASWPLMEAQAGLWYAQRMAPDNAIYNVGQVMHIAGALDLEAFRLAADAAAAEADTLSLQVFEQAGQPRQRRDATLVPRLSFVDLRQAADPLAELRQAMRADMRQPIDLTRGPLARQVLFQTGADRFHWYLRIHHYAIDGYGLALLEGRVAERYRQACAGLADDPSRRFAAFAPVLADEQAYNGSERQARDRAFWLEQFQQAPRIADLGAGTPVTSDSVHLRSVTLDAAWCERLRARASATDTPWPDMLLALTAAYLCRHSGDSETVLGVPHMGRLGQVSARCPAMVMNTLPLRVAVNEDQPLDDFIIATARQLRQARRHGRYRSEQLRRDLGLLGGQRRLYGPLVNVLPFDTPFDLGSGLDTRRENLGAGPVDDLTLTYTGDAEGRHLVLGIEANPGRYDLPTVDAHLARLPEFLQDALDAPCLAQAPTISAARGQAWLAKVRGPEHDVPRTTLWALAQQNLDHASGIAVEDEHGSLDYPALGSAVAAYAAQLHRAGVRRGSIVGIALPRQNGLLVALLATLRLGAAYLPLDTSHPPARLATILASARPAALVATADTDLPLPAGTPRLDGPARDLEADSADHEELAQAELPRPDDAAYVIYTSGSTGEPKGVVVEHDAIVNRLLWMQVHYGIDASDSILQKTPATFDVSVWEFFLPALAGARLVFAPPEAHRDPVWLGGLIRRYGITTLHFVPSMLGAFLETADCAGLVVRRVFCSGEALPPALRDRFHQRIQGELHNLYGPTEAAVDVSWWPASREDDTQPVPIGYPVWNTSLYVLDDRLRLVPPGVAGQLYIAGRQLARGYLGRDDLTRERYIPDPYGLAGARMYATGDVARWRHDGALVYLGRSDHQVKLRGLRIELGEIESALEHAEGLAHVAVVLREDSPGQARLVAYVVWRDGVVQDTESLRELATQRLPDYMVPAAFVTLDALPLTSSGKLDRKALPAPAMAASAGRAPSGETETSVAALYREVLTLPPEITLGADDDFFDLGGHSLLAARLLTLLHDRWQHAIGLGALFEHTTVARLAAYLDALDARQAQAGDEGFGPYVHWPARATTTALPALFCVHPAGGLGWCYGGLARALQDERPVYALQARALIGDTGPATELATMARDYVDTMVEVQPHGPYHLLGWSVGGILAQAMAVELQARGLAVGVVAMLDAYPSDCWRAHPDPGPNGALKALMHIAGFDVAALGEAPLTRDVVIGFLRRSGHPLGALDDRRLGAILAIVDGNNRLVRGHHHGRYAGPVLYYRAALDHESALLDPDEWLPYVGRLERHDLQAVHAHLVGDAAVRDALPALIAALHQADQTGTGTP